MRNWKAIVHIDSLTGLEEREIKLQARTRGSAERKISRMMGNRSYVLITLKEDK